MNANGRILYEGPSLIDGAPIVAIVVGLADDSANSKTGGMLQTFILRSDVAPLDALKTGADASVCGDCKHRPFNGGACYVNVGHAPRGVWQCYKRGSGYAPAEDLRSIGRGRAVRLGTYGDPAAVPASIWRELIAESTLHTGYTHQWGSGRAGEGLRDIVMASCDTPSERDKARAQGWRTFTVRTAADPLAARESVCPASEEAGKRIQCAQCGACDGAGSGRKGSIAIIAHGATKRRYFELRKAA